MGFQVVRYPEEELLNAEMPAEHSDDRTPLEITDVVKNLVNF